MRFYTLAVSIVVHVVLVIVLIVIPLYAMDALPGARQAIEFVQANAAELPDPPPPPGPPRKPSAADVAPNTAPSKAPDRIAPDVPVTRVDTVVPLSDGAGGVPGGLPGGVPPPAVPDPVPPAARAPFRPGGVIRVPKKIKDVLPVYPPLAQAVHKEGIVVLEAVIGEDGRVRDVRVLRSIPLLDQAAVDAVRQWRFTPTLLNGEPVPVVMTVTVSFQLK